MIIVKIDNIGDYNSMRSWKSVSDQNVLQVHAEK